ncbi:hypothetical protein PUN28_011448 [Cardiocondyla obscurior]|uniref:Uncharacterized protein n=1 Tax=Cardiocondyla obscurior TaxID=286306 RepID=A0AAW2FDU6_9HYME
MSEMILVRNRLAISRVHDTKFAVVGLADAFNSISAARPFSPFPLVLLIPRKLRLTKERRVCRKFITAKTHPSSPHSAYPSLPPFGGYTCLTPVRLLSDPK